MKWLRILLGTLFLLALSVSCAELLDKPASNPAPTEYIPSITSALVTTSQQEAAQSTPEPIEATLENDSTVASQGSANRTPASPTAADIQIPQSSATLTPTQTIDNALPATQSAAVTRTPTLTPTLQIPSALIQIEDPGPLSRILSPLNMVANIRSVPGGSFHIELWAEPLLVGEEPRLLLREVNNFIADPIPWVYLNESLEFELSRVSELGVLRILTYDRYGRSVAAASVEMILLQFGENLLTPNGDVLEPLVIHEPAPNILIQGGSLIVAGLVRLMDSQPLLVELVAADGSVKGVQQIFLTPDPSGEYIPFTAEVAYSVSSPTWVRLVISQSGSRIPGVRMLHSLEVLLSP